MLKRHTRRVEIAKSARLDLERAPGCSLGGEWDFDGRPAGWGTVDDDEPVAAVRTAYEGGVRLVDTADVYGCGHAEEVVGRAIAPFRDDIVLATRAGHVFDEVTRAGRWPTCAGSSPSTVTAIPAVDESCWRPTG